MKGLTQIQDADDSFSAVDELIALVEEVKTIMGSETKIGYAADWSEYHSTNGWYNMDPLWASDNIDFIGIDAYFPLTDREQNGIYDKQEIIDGWENGEGYDWYYTDEERTVKADLTPQDAWKNIEYWWNNTHTNPDSEQTEFVPQSKKIWFTEFGFPSVDGCANQPNVFYNPDSVDGNLPYLSKGYIDFLAQRTALQGTLAKWQNSEMVEQKFIWAYDARSYPFYPDMKNVWGDGNLWSRGHWINGKLGVAELKNIISDLCKKAGIETPEINNVNKLVSGYNLSGAITALEALRTLQSGYFFDFVESDKVKFFPRQSENTEEINIDFSRLIFEKNNETMLFENASSLNITSNLSLNYISENNNYLVGNFDISREDKNNSSGIEINLPLLLNRSYAEKIAQTLLLEEEAITQKIEFSLPSEYLYIEAGDIVNIIKNDETYKLKIISSLTQQGKIKISAIRFENDFYSSANEELTTDYNSENLEPISDTYFEIIDTHHLPNETSIDKAYLHLAVCGTSSNWNGCAIYVSNISATEGFQKITDIVSPATMGVIETELLQFSSPVIDKINQLNINLIGGTLESLTEDNLQSFGNLALIGNENFQFKNINQTELNKYTLSHLYRGRQGTENYAGETHPAGSRFILLDENVLKIEMPVSQIGQTIWIKAVTFGKSADDVTAKEINFSGNSLKPYSPVHISAEREMDDDINIQWLRRSRGNISFSSSVEIPVFETKEEYEIDIFDASTLKRTEKITSPSFNYTEGMQSSDFGSLATNFTARIYQMSDKVGRGEVAITEVLL